MWGSHRQESMRSESKKPVTMDPNVPAKKEIKVKIEPVDDDVEIVDDGDKEPSVNKLVAAVQRKDKDTVKKYRKFIRVGAKAEATRLKRKHQPYKKNQWNIHLDSFRKEHPDKTFGQCLIDAKATYKYKI